MTTPQATLIPAATEAPGNLAAQLAELAEQRAWTDRPAFHQGHRSFTHGQVHDLAARAATVLAEHGVGPGDRVLLALPDSVAWVTAFLATARLGAVAVLTDDRFPRRIRLGADQLVALTQAAPPTADAHQVDAHSPLYIQYTSGTTGRPKGVVHCHGDPKTYHDLIGRRLLRITPDDVTLSVSKLFFASWTAARARPPWTNSSSATA